MNIVQWVEERLHIRICLCYCNINIGGQSYEAVIDGPCPFQYIGVSYTDNEGVEQKLTIHLGHIEMMPNGMVFLFSTSNPNDESGTLIIPPGRLDLDLMAGSDA